MRRKYATSDTDGVARTRSGCRTRKPSHPCQDVTPDLASGRSGSAGQLRPPRAQQSRPNRVSTIALTGVPAEGGGSDS